MTDSKLRIQSVPTELVDESAVSPFVVENPISQDHDGVFRVTSMAEDGSETLRRIHVPTKNEVFFASVGNFYETRGGVQFEAPSLNVFA